VGPAARPVAPLARKTGPSSSRAAATWAWAACHPPRGRGVCCRATSRGRAPLSGRPLAPVGPPGGWGRCRRPRAGSDAWRSARPAGRSPGGCGGRRGRGGDCGGRRAWAGAAWAPAAALAVPCPALSGGSGHATTEPPATRPPPQGRVASGSRALASQERGRSPRAVRRYPGLDRPGRHGGSRERDRCGAAAGLPGAAHDGGPRLSPEQQPGGAQPRVAGAAGTPGGLGPAPGGGFLV
jgi:hypothetical protein